MDGEDEAGPNQQKQKRGPYKRYLQHPNSNLIGVPYRTSLRYEAGLEAAYPVAVPADEPPAAHCSGSNEVAPASVETCVSPDVTQANELLSSEQNQHSDESDTMSSLHMQIVGNSDTSAVGSASDGEDLHAGFKTTSAVSDSELNSSSVEKNKNEAPQTSSCSPINNTQPQPSTSYDSDSSYKPPELSPSSSDEDTDLTRRIESRRQVIIRTPSFSTTSTLQNNNRESHSGREIPSTSACNTPATSHFHGEQNAAPLVDKSKIGAKRRETLKATTMVDEIDLEELLKSDRFAKGVLQGYIETKVLGDDDRKIIVKTIVQWLLSQTDFPTKTHYESLAGKVCALFPSEQMSLYYVAPFTEGETQKCAKGKLPMKVKNAKSWLRSKGAIEKKQKRRRHSDGSDNEEAYEELEAEVVGAKVWLERNKEPFEDVRKHWNTCKAHRLVNHILRKKTKPHEYVKEWSNILKLPLSYKLVFDDYAALPALIPMYASMQGTEENLSKKWPDFSKKIYCLAKSDRSKKNLKQLLTCYEEITSEDVKDLKVLEMLCELCKAQGVVKVGSKIFKPSGNEAKCAFLLTVTVAANFNNDIKAREEYYKKLDAPIQPFVIIVGPRSEVEASYVYVNGVVWQLGSVLQAIDVCFKSFYALNAEYPPEARHFWLCIQHALYNFQLPRERIISCVTALVGRLATAQTH